MENKSLMQVTMTLSIIAAVLGALDAVGVNIWLSASSWLLVSAVLGIWTLILRPSK